MAANLYFGSFNISDGVNYYVTSRPVLSASWSQTYYKIGRMEGMKKTGDTANQRQLQVKILVVGSSRLDLEAKLQALYQALALKQQQLQIFITDARAYVADCTDAVASLVAGKPNSVEVTATFVAAQPFAVAPMTSTATTGTVTLALVSGSTYSTTYTVTGGGTIYSRPQIRITKLDALTWNTLSLLQAVDNMTIAPTTRLPSANGDYIDIFCDPTGAAGWTIQRNSDSVLATFNGVFPVLEPTSTSFTLTITTSAAGTCQASIATTWYARYI